eukprot:GFYU01003062.1.p1 GENE.GFYU01003062.1~~GFYU01003062.1.p1  ORF type:complete len:162 (+),score=28.16 GFYU01003062.1:1-486(+)
MAKRRKPNKDGKLPIPKKYAHKALPDDVVESVRKVDRHERNTHWTILTTAETRGGALTTRAMKCFLYDLHHRFGSASKTVADTALNNGTVDMRAYLQNEYKDIYTRLQKSQEQANQRMIESDDSDILALSSESSSESSDPDNYVRLMDPDFLEGLSDYDAN